MPAMVDAAYASSGEEPVEFTAAILRHFVTILSMSTLYDISIHTIADHTSVVVFPGNWWLSYNICLVAAGTCTKTVFDTVDLLDW